VRLFLADDAWSELTSGAEPAVRVTAADLGQARRARARLRGGPERVAVILDIEVAVAGDVRVAAASLAGTTAGVRYAGTVDGLAGLIADIESAEVADGVTLIASASAQDLRGLGEDVLRRLAERGRISA
jgi:urease gamma subunit